jgi:hypothetical protein
VNDFPQGLENSLSLEKKSLWRHSTFPAPHHREFASSPCSSSIKLYVNRMIAVDFLNLPAKFPAAGKVSMPAVFGLFHTPASRGGDATRQIVFLHPGRVGPAAPTAVEWLHAVFEREGNAINRGRQT